jgi:multidrug efflux system membrane fusion protein
MRERRITHLGFHQRLAQISPVALGLAVLLVLTGALACTEKSPGAGGGGGRQRPAEGPVPVLVATATQKTVPVEIKTIGSVEAYATVSVKAQIEGTLDRVYFKEGDEVTSGQTLFTIDPRPFVADLQQAQATLARDRVTAANARRVAERAIDLYGREIVSQEERDNAVTAVQTADALVRADQAAVESARVRLSYCTIRSPLTGRTGDLRVDRGNIVRNSDVLVTIVQTSPVYVTFSANESRLPEVRKYMAACLLKVLAWPDSSGSAPVEGVLTFVDNTVDPTMGMVMLKAAFPNKDKALWPGQYVDAALVLTEEPDMTVVPADAVQAGQQGSYVFVIGNDMKAELRPVVSERTFEETAGGPRLSVIQKGVKPGERVVTDGQLRLLPGSPVQIKEGLTTGTTQTSRAGRDNGH